MPLVMGPQNQEQQGRRWAESLRKQIIVFIGNFHGLFPLVLRLVPGSVGSPIKSNR